MFVILAWDSSNDIHLVKNEHHETAVFPTARGAESFMLDEDDFDYYRIVQLH